MHAQQVGENRRPIPASLNNDANLDSGEYVRFFTVLPGDQTGDWLVDANDLPGFVSVLLGQDTAPAHLLAAYLNVDTRADADDIPAFVAKLLN